jgi:hypothetical protein
MQSIDGDPSGNSIEPVKHYRETVRAEESLVWKTTHFTNEDTWFWDIFSLGKRSYTVALSARATSGPDAVLRSEFVSNASDPTAGPDHHTQIHFNNDPDPIGDFYWSGLSRYEFEYKYISPYSITNGTNTFYIEALNDAQVKNPSLYFDWFEIEYNRFFEAENNAITFTSGETGTQKYQVSDFTNTSGATVLDISNPIEPVHVLNPYVQPFTITISLTHPEPISITMAAGDLVLPQNQISYYEAPDWSTMNGGFDYVYITHADFLTSTQALANYRSGTGLSTVVVDINDLYNEFNFGIYHPIAIKNFLAYAYDNWGVKPTYALLVGDGHWNFHEYNTATYGSGPQFMPPNLAWVDPWQGEVDSANLLATVSGADVLPDLKIARLPVNSSAEIDAYLSKLVGYEAPHIPEPWEQNHVFVADNADVEGNFPHLSDEIINNYIVPAPNAREHRIYQDDFDCTNPSSPGCVIVRNEITNTINITGALILNYVGHASFDWWSREYIFTPAELANLTNSDKLPVILSMDCLDGYWIGPSNLRSGFSIIEEIVRQSDSGAIGAFSPTGLGVSSGHDILHAGFYYALMHMDTWELGAAAENAKLWLFYTGQNQDLIHTFTVFGDPALEIRNHKYVLVPLLRQGD